MDQSRRSFLQRSLLFGTGLVAGQSINTGNNANIAQASQQAHHHQTNADTDSNASGASPIVDARKLPGPIEVVPCVAPDLTKLPWTMDNGVKVFHLQAEVVKRELLPAGSMGPAKIIDCWGYNGSMPGPTIEVNEGDRVRFHFHNMLPEDTTVHWHGLEIPIEMDGTPNISQPMVKPGESFVYEFTLHQNGTFFYHSHSAMQEMMGLIGLFIIHPRKPHQPAVHKDFAYILQEWAVLPNNTVPNTMAMEYNWLTLNGKSAPATTPLIVKLGERVRIRLVNMGMDHHPIHIHGHQFHVTGTEGGRVPQSAWYPGNTVIVGVAQARDIEFDAIYPGDWMLHCHLPHHMMNNMVSMVGPMMQMDQGSQTGMGMEAGMGIVKSGNALDPSLAPGMGRGMSITADRERNVSNSAGANTAMSNMNMPNNAMPQHQHQHSDDDMSPKQRVPGYPQDDMMMMMVYDKEVAKPETNGLAPGWCASVQGMMTLVRVLPPDKYDQMMQAINSGKTDQPQQSPMEHHHHH